MNFGKAVTILTNWGLPSQSLFLDCDLSAFSLFTIWCEKFYSAFSPQDLKSNQQTIERMNCTTTTN